MCVWTERESQLASSKHECWFSLFARLIQIYLFISSVLVYIYSEFWAWKIYIFYSFVSLCCATHTRTERKSAICDKNPKKDRMVMERERECGWTHRTESVLFGRSVVAVVCCIFSSCFFSLCFKICVRDCKIARLLMQWLVGVRWVAIYNRTTEKRLFDICVQQNGQEERISK